MKRLLLLLFLLVVVKANADQLQIITQYQAQQTENLFKNNGIRQVILFCGCCENEQPVKVNIDKYYTKIYNASANEYEFVIEGHTEGGKQIKESVDLAYTFLKVGTKAECLGKILSFECDPCTLPFEWNTVTTKPGTVEILNNGTNGRLLINVPKSSVYVSQSGKCNIKVWVNRDGEITRYIILSVTNQEIRSLIETRIKEFRFNKLPSAPVEQNGVLSILIKASI